MNNQLSSYKKIKELFEQYPELEYDKLCYYIGICNTKEDVSDEEHYISLEDLENVPISDIQDMFFDSKIYRLENYKSKVVVEKNDKDCELEYGK